MDETIYPTDNTMFKSTTLPNSTTKLQPVKELSVESVKELSVESVKELSVESVKEEVMEPVKEEVMEKLLAQCKDIGIKKSTLTIVIRYVIEAVEETPVKGSAQKEYAMRLLRLLIQEFTQEEDKEYLLNAIDDGSIGDIIDLIVSASKGELNINKVIQPAATFLPYCVALLGKCVKMPKNI